MALQGQESSISGPFQNRLLTDPFGPQFQDQGGAGACPLLLQAHGIALFQGQFQHFANRGRGQGVRLGAA
jgi:hypothetical protein